MNSCWDMAGLTDTGQVRAHNEDAIGWDSVLGFAVLADGVGGRKAGEVASDLAVGRIKTLLRHAFCAGPDGSPDLARRDHTTALAEAAVREANATILKAGNDRAEYSGMATTVVLALFGTDHVTVSHVGDSRLYRLRRDRLEQLTVDHSLAQEFVETGYLSQEQARASAHRNVVTRALGVTNQVRVDVGQYETELGDVYLLCTDGLSNPVSELEIRRELSQAENDVPETVRRLVSLANDNGGDDNITVIVARRRF